MLQVVTVANIAGSSVSAFVGDGLSLIVTCVKERFPISCVGRGVIVIRRDGGVL